MTNVRLTKQQLDEMMEEAHKTSTMCDHLQFDFNLTVWLHGEVKQGCSMAQRTLVFKQRIGSVAPD